MLLRVAARGLHAARALQALEPSTRRWASAPDELLAAFEGTLDAAVESACRTLTTLVGAAAEEAADLCASVAVVDDGDAVAAAVRTAALLPRAGLAAFDERCWDVAIALGFLPVPRLTRTLDPRAPRVRDRIALAARLGTPPFVGRPEVVQRLVSLLRQSPKLGSNEPSRAAAQPRDDALLIELVGPAGIGRAETLRQALRESGDEVLALWGGAGGAHSGPYHPLVSMLRAAAGAPLGHPLAFRRVTALLRVLGAYLDAEAAAELRALEPLVGSLLGAPAEERQDARVSEHGPGPVNEAIKLPEGMAWSATFDHSLPVSMRRLMVLVCEGLRARAGVDRRAVVVVTGAEHLDQASRDVLWFAARRLGSALAVVLLSDGRGARFAGAEHIELRPLKPAAAQALLTALLSRANAGADGDPALSPEVEKAVRALAARAGGSPLHLLHAVRCVVEDGSVVERDGALHVEAFDARRVPVDPARLLHERIARLPASAQRLLQAAAALGPRFSRGALEHVGVLLSFDHDEVTAAVALLCEAALLVRSAPGPSAPLVPDVPEPEDDQLAFGHPSIAAVALDLDPAASAVVAAAAATVVDALWGHGHPSAAHALARLHVRAGAPDRALTHLVFAARFAAAAGDTGRLETILQTALPLAADDVMARAQLLLSRLQAATMPGVPVAPAQVKRALDDAEQVEAALSASTEPVHRALLSRLRERCARGRLLLGDPEGAAAHARDVLAAAADGAIDDDATAAARRVLVAVSLSQDDPAAAAAAIEHARARLRKDDRRGRALLALQEGLLLIERDALAPAAERLLEARTLRRQDGDRIGEAAVVEVLADLYARKGELGVAAKMLDRAAAQRAAIGDVAGAAHGGCRHAELRLQMGDAEGARAAAESARSAAAALGLVRLERQANIAAARGAIAAGEPAAADLLIDKLLRRRGVKDAAFEAEAAWVSVRARWWRARDARGASRQKHLEAAARRAQEAFDRARGLRRGHVLLMAAYADVLLAKGDTGGALPLAQRAAEIVDDRPHTALPVDEVLGTFARVLEALGDEGEAALVRRRAWSFLQVRLRSLATDDQVRFWGTAGRRLLMSELAASPLSPSTNRSFAQGSR